MIKSGVFPSDESGSVLVESALVLTCFLAIIFGIMEAGRLMQVHNAVTEAARDGARFAISPLRGTSDLPDNAAIADHVRQYLAAVAISKETATVVSETVHPYSGDSLTTCTQVSVSLPYRVLAPYVPLGEVTLKAQSVMRNETSK
jgi:Flp pilus assembly protein TadG